MPRMRPAHRLMLLALLLVGASASATQPPRNILVLYADNRLLPIISIIDQSLESELQSQPGTPFELYNEFLDIEQARAGQYPADLAAFLQRKYATTRIDVILAVRGPSLRFAVDQLGKVFPGVPVVAVATSTQELVGKQWPPNVYGVPMKLEPEKTVELALRLHPGARRVVVITGASPFDRQWESLLRQALRPIAQQVSIEYWAGLPAQEMLERIRALPSDAIIFSPGVRQDGTGQRFVPKLLGDRMVAASPVPFYGGYSNLWPTGPIGGYVAPLDGLARSAARITERLLRGEVVEPLVSTPPAKNVYMLNMRQLQRFGVDESQLPAGAILRFREPTLWEQYHWQVSLVLAVLLLQTGLIAALLMQLRARRRAERELVESERRMSLAAAATGLGIWQYDISRSEAWASPQHRALVGIGEDGAVALDRLLGAVADEGRASLSDVIQRAMEEGGEFEQRYRVRLPGGEIRWIATRGRAELDAHGAPVLLRGVTVDVTNQQEADIAAQLHRDEMAHLSRVGMLGQLSGSLAHELNQPLAAILSNAQAAQRFLQVAEPDLEEVREILRDIVADDQRAGNVIRRLRALFARGKAADEPVDMNDVVREVLALVRGDLVAHGVTVSTRHQSPLPIVRGDRVQLQQLLLNLILNAREAMVDTAPAERRLEIHTSCDDGRDVLVTVADHGKGIAEADLESIFEPFVSGKVSGTGLGLAIGRSIAIAHRGRLWASSAEGSGATFWLAVPVQDADQHDRR